jgi:RimJ/RimL family protein N-acetyltransferase
MYGSTLEGERIRLQPPCGEYARCYMRWFANPALTKFMDVRNPLSYEQQLEWLGQMASSEHNYVWTIVLRSTDEPIGDTGLHRIDWRHRQAISRLIIGDSCQWNKGFASEAIRLRTAYAFEELGLEKVMSTVHEQNQPSRRALEKAGYHQCGWLRHNRYYGGGWHDEWMGEILREEWMADRTNGRYASCTVEGWQ